MLIEIQIKTSTEPGDNLRIRVSCEHYADSKSVRHPTYIYEIIFKFKFKTIRFFPSDLRFVGEGGRSVRAERDHGKPHLCDGPLLGEGGRGPPRGHVPYTYI